MNEFKLQHFVVKSQIELAKKIYELINPHAQFHVDKQINSTVGNY